MAGPDKSSTLQRIERLERLEQERLEHQEQLRRCRDETLQRARGGEAVFGLAWGVLAGAVLTADPGGTALEVLVGLPDGCEA